MAIRFAKNVHVPLYKCTSGMFTSPGTLTGDGLIRCCRAGNTFIRVAPSRYSNVRKVIFYGALQWVENNGARNVDVRLMVGPMSKINTGRNIAVTTFPQGGLVRTVDFAGQTAPWPYEPYNLVLATWPDDMLYEKRGVQDTLNGGYTGIGDQDVHMFRIEFDRFAGDSDDFFTDWDNVYEDGDDDAYVGYNVNAGLVESTFVAGSVSNLRILSAGCTIIQAPGSVNNTCTVVEASRISGFYTTDLCLSRRTTYSTWPDEHKGIWRYHAADWDGITEITQWNQAGMGIINAGQAWKNRVVICNDPAAAETVISQVDHVGLGGAAKIDVVRSSNILSQISDGDLLSADFLIEGLGGNDTTGVMQHLEIIQKSTTKTTFILPTGALQSNLAPNTGARTGQGYWNPISFEDFPDDMIYDRRAEGTLRHENAAWLCRWNFRHDAQLDARDTTPFTSATGLTVGGAQINSSGLNDALNPQVTFQQYPIAGNDPFQLAGERKLHGKGDGAIVGSDDGGYGFLSYVHDVPSEETPELGPIFQLGEFDPEGCAATSAGLGDPGVLVITNGSTIPKKYDPQGNQIEDAGIPLPFKDETPSSTVGSTSLSPTGGLNLGVYTYRYTFRNCCTDKESDPNPDDITVDTTGASPGAQVTLSFAGVRIPGDPQICEICLYRTVVGGDFPVMAKVGCFNIDDTELFVDDVADDELDFTNDGLSLLNAPMPCVPVVVEFRNRLFGLGDIPSLSPAGTVSVVNGSTWVTGDEDVEWTRCLAGKWIQFEGDCRAYEIDSVQPPALGLSPPLARLILVEEYEGTTDTGLNYTICGKPNRLYVSEPFEAEYWPNASFLDVEPGDGDRLMGGVSNFGRLVICKRNKSYALTFNENPVLEVAAPQRISSDIGCIGPRTFAQVETGSVWLADRGLAIFDGRSVSHLPESDRMNELFVDPDNDRYVRRDRNGRVIGAVGVFYPKREQYLLMVPTKQTTRGANLMLVWDTKLRNITLYEFCQEFVSMVVAKDADGNERVYMGDVNGFVWILDIGHTDGVGYPNSTGTLRGTFTAAGVEADTGASYLEDSSASFLTGGVPDLAGLSGVVGLSGSWDGDQMGLAGVCVYYRQTTADKDEPWQVRQLYAATPTRLYVTPNWAGEAPDLSSASYEYMLGPINFRAVFKPKDYGTNDFQKRLWSQIVSFVPENVASKLRVELLADLEDTDEFEDLILSGDGEERGDGRIFDLSFSKGRLTQPVEIKVHNYMGLRFTNFAPEEPIQLLNHTIRMTGRPQ